MGADVVEPQFVVETDEVGGAVGVSGMETGAAGGEVPVVFCVKIGSDMVGKVVVVCKRGVVVGVGEELAVVVEVVPA